MSEYDYDSFFDNYHTSAQAAEFLIRLYDSNKVVGIVDRENFMFKLCSPLFDYAGNSQYNQKNKVNDEKKNRSNVIKEHI